jgi:hypothetical protein
MAFKTQRENHRPAEKTAVRGTVGLMAYFAAADTHGGMLEDEWSSLIGMALQAGLFVRENVLYQSRPHTHAPGGSGSTVGIMAIRAVHKSLVDPVLERHGELRADISVARVAKLRLPARQQELGYRRSVNGVARSADDIRITMRRTTDVRTCELTSVTAQTIIKRLSWAYLRERDDGRFAPTRFYVRLAGSVTAFAARFLRRAIAGRDRTVMRVLIEVQSDVGMARPAYSASHIA